MKHRLFLSLDLPDSLKEEIVVLQKELIKNQFPVVWAPKDNLHLTLNFLGRVDDDKINSLSAIIRKVAAAALPFTLTPEFLETMYQKHKGSFVYLGLTGDLDSLKQLQKNLAFEFAKRDIPQPLRYMPHLSIGSLKRDDPVVTKSVLDKINSIESKPLSGFVVEKLALYESFPARSGSHYQKVSSFNIGRI